MYSATVRDHMEHVLAHNGCYLWRTKNKGKFDACSPSRCVIKKEYGNCTSIKIIRAFAVKWLKEHDDENIRKHMEHIIKYDGCSKWVNDNRAMDINPCTPDKCIVKGQYGYCPTFKQVRAFAIKWLGEHGNDNGAAGVCESIW